MLERFLKNQQKKYINGDTFFRYVHHSKSILALQYNMKWMKWWIYQAHCVAVKICYNIFVQKYYFTTTVRSVISPRYSRRKVKVRFPTPEINVDFFTLFILWFYPPLFMSTYVRLRGSRMHEATWDRSPSYHSITYVDITVCRLEYVWVLNSL